MVSTDSFKSQVVISQDLNNLSLDGEQCFLLFDEKVENVSPEIQSFIQGFPYRLGVQGGEALKSFKDFPKNFDRLIRCWPQPIKRSQTLVVLGGGSLGDFGGFVASILKRGVQLIQVPSTWLAAMDSAHGGKNGLNRNGVKNQLGTFYPAKKVIVAKSLLEGSPEELKEQAFGELIKMALIGESKFFKEIIMEKRSGKEFLWRFMKFCIEDKYHVVLQDPLETRKVRQVLNFGHSLGHALESHFSWPHGDSVLQGIFFSLEWSRHLGLMTQGVYDQIVETISQRFDRGPAYALDWYRPPNKESLRSLLEKDKKIDQRGEILFTFLKNIGQPHLRPVSIDDLLAEAQRQGWLK